MSKPATPQSPKDIIKAYLDNRAAIDPQFAVSYAKPQKSIDECYRFILGEARKRGAAVCMTDAEVFGLAVHYYDEDDIKIQSTSTEKVQAHAVAAPELTKDEKKKAHRIMAKIAANKAARKKDTKQPATRSGDDPRQLTFF